MRAVACLSLFALALSSCATRQHHYETCGFLLVGSEGWIVPVRLTQHVVSSDGHTFYEVEARNRTRAWVLRRDILEPARCEWNQP